MRMSVAKAAKILQLDVVTLRELIKRKEIPIGLALKKEGSSRYTFILYEKEVLDFAESKGIET